MYKKLPIGLIIVVLAAVGISYLIKPRNAAPTRPLNIGLMVGATGPYAFIGDNYTKGVNLAKEQWLKDHPGQEVNLFLEDDGFDQKKGVLAYQKLTSIDHIDALVNMTSTSIDAIYSQAKDANLPIAQGGEQGIEPTDDNVFQMIPGNIATEITLGAAVKDKGFNKVTVFVANNSTFVRFLNGFKKGYGGDVNEILINPDERDYRTHVTKGLENDPDAVVILTTPEQGANVVKIMRQLSPKPHQFIFDANIQTGFPDYQRILGDMNILNGSVVVDINQHSNPEFVSAFKAKYGSDPGVGTDWAYDQFMLLMRTYSPDRVHWIANMKKASFDGAGGKVEFDEVGVRKPDFTIGSITDGKLTPGT